jgi:predicted  nucleic acid-binding Zn-ribbon protein
LREQLKLLEELQRLDLELYESDKALEALPAKLQSMKSDVSRIEQMLDADRQRLQETQTYKNELEEAINHDRELLTKAKNKMQQVRTSKEYMAIQREFETNRKLTAEREEELTKLEAAIKETQATVDERAKQLAELQQHVQDEAKETESRLAELEEGVKGKRETREEMAAKVQKALVRKYDRIRRLRDGLAVCMAEKGVCTGCRMQLPPQLYNILQRQETIEQCPNCQRIVYYVEPEPEENGEAASA